MGSKKHKKESKKKKHRSRSRSPLEGEEHRERKRHKKHKDRKKARSPDVEEVPVDSHLVAQSSTDNGTRDKGARVDNGSADHEHKDNGTHVEYGAREHSMSSSEDRERDRDRKQRPHREESHESERHRAREQSPPSPPKERGGAAQESLSIEESNRLRAKLGLKPLQLAEKPAEDGKIKDDLGEFYHKPAANIAAQKKSEKIRERLEERREKRKLEQKLQIQTLGEASDDEDASAWVQKSREMEKQKQEAAKRAAMLDEMDAVFGVSALVEEDEREQRHYAAPALKGLRVAHDLDMIGSERETILTLADKEVLAEDAEDVLVNVNIVDDERVKKNLQEKKKARAGYQAYDDEEEMEALALGYRKPVLAKYDDEIDKEREFRERGFVIGDEAALEARRFKDMMRQERLAGGPDKRLESLRLPELRLASEYLDEHEINAKFKKPRKRGKMRKKAKQEPIDVDDYDAGTAPLETDDTEVKPEQLKMDTGLSVDEEEVEVDSELQTALARARRLRQAAHADHAGQAPRLPKVEDILTQVKEEGPEEEEEEEEGGGRSTMVLDSTAEFCRTLGDIPTYGLAGNRDTRADILDFEKDDMDIEPEGEQAGAGAGAAAGGAWSRVDVGSDLPPDLAAGSSVGLEAEPALGCGVAGALRLALSKGYLERSGAAPPRPPPATAALLHAKNYSIEDKTATQEDDKYGRRERGHGGHGGHGPLVEFREKAGFRPHIKLDYVDDEGRALCPKEAFRYLSHKFHGKGPGKNKQEKRIKKQVQEGLMKKMSSTDTPLGTLQMLQDKQRETHSPYIVLSGTKRPDNQ